MLIKVKVFPNSGKRKVVKKKKDQFEVYTRERAEKGRANKEACRLISSYFNLKKGGVRIVRGGQRRNKIVEVKGI